MSGHQLTPGDIRLKWEQAGPDAAPEALMDAVRDQLGLELKPAKRPVEVVVLDVEQPTSGK